MKVTLLQAALTYTQANGAREPWAIFPLTPGGKVPTAGSHGFKDATTDRAQIVEWWTKTPDANIGIATGERNGFIVIDSDQNHEPGVDGEETIRGLESTLGPLPDTVTALTPNGGIHRYFKYPSSGADFRNFEGRKRSPAAPGVDGRANGGYVAAPPSMVNGRCYEWEATAYPSEHEMAELPDAWAKWWLEGCSQTAGQSQGQGQNQGERFTLPDAVLQGARNSTLYKYGASLRGKGKSADEIRTELQRCNSERCKPPLEDREINSIIGSVLKLPEPETEPRQTEKSTTHKRGRLTLAILADEMAQRGMGVRYNLITRECEVIGQSATGRALNIEDLVTFMHDTLAGTYIGVSFDTLKQYVVYDAREKQYNPVIELLKATPWDGISRIGQVYQLLGIQDDDLSQKLVNKWLYQTICLLFNRPDQPFGADGALVLNGAQGTGKTSFFRHLALLDAWFGEGATIDDRDKDTTRRVLSKWITELGEVESTLKSDISKLKAFITSAVDAYRLPYGKTDIVMPRTTSLCATCNSDRYLIDTTGNRRWWSVPLRRRIPRAELLQLDALQLWAEIFSAVEPISYERKAQMFRLSDNEQQRLADRNAGFEKPLKGQVEVEDVLAQARAKGMQMQEVTVTAFKESWPALRKYSAQQIGIALKAAGVDTKHSRNGTCAMLPLFNPLANT